MNLSILIPAYNAAQYLRQCLDSIVPQLSGNDSVEVLILNDGSTDETQDIIDEYVSRNDFIRFIARENLGIGPTRNELIENAKGDFFWFVDADDQIASGTIDGILGNLQLDNLDCLMLGYQIESQSGDVRKYIYEGDFKNGIALTKAQVYNNAVWSRIYRTRTVKESGVRFGKFCMGEEFDFTFRLIPYLGRSVCLNEIVYRYILRLNSATQNKDYEHRRKVADDSLALIMALEGYFDLFSPEDAFVLRQPFNDNLIAFVYSLIQQKHPFRYKLSVIRQLKKAGFIPIKPIVSSTPKRVKFIRLINNPVTRFAMLIK